MSSTTTTTNIGSYLSFSQKADTPVLLVAYAPEGLVPVDRFAVPALFLIGRSSKSGLTIKDNQVSKLHCRIAHAETGTTIEDLGSTNGTFVNGHKIENIHQLSSPSVIRVAQVLLVFVKDGGPLLELSTNGNHGIAGRFHTDQLIADLSEAALSSRHILLAGPTGSGKELAAGALASMISRNDEQVPFVAHNAGLFANEDEAATTLFGVSKKVFSGVDARVGLIEQANGGTLFLDEISNLPLRIQQSLLRIIEDGKIKRIGETRYREVRVRYIFASNRDDPHRGLAPDFFARLRVVKIPSLVERVADIPSIFNAVLSASLKKRNLDHAAVLKLTTCDHYEALCLDGFGDDNVRGLIDLADRLTTKISAGRDPGQALFSVFNERFQEGPAANRESHAVEKASVTGTNQTQTRSHYERHREAITAVYREQNGNISATVRLLKKNGIRCSRRWLTVFVEQWGLK